MSEITENTLTAYLGPDFQLKLLWQLLVEPEFAEKTLPSIATEYFDDPSMKRMFIIIWEFYKEFGKVPNFQNKSIHLAINKYKTPNNLVEEETLFGVLKRVENWNNYVINKQLLYDGDIVQKEANNFIKQQEYRKIGEFIIEKTKSGEIKNKHVIAQIEENFQKISQIGEENDDCEEVIDNIDSALRKEFRQTIPTGVQVIDELTGGGLGKGEIGLILTPSGVGKTTLLTKIANTAYEDGKYVAQIIFEDTKDQVKRKHYTIWSGIAQSKLDDNLELARERVRSKIEEVRGKGKLIIKRFSQENTTMVDIRNWMLSYQKKFGVKFDILILDYLDCLEPHKKASDRNEAEFMIIKSFEALAADFDIPAWTAIQSNRSGFSAEFLEAHNSGGNIKRIQKSHFFMTVAKTPEQKEADLANILVLKARFAKDGQKFQDCIFNNDTLEIRIEDDRYKSMKFSQGKKHHDIDDINKLESDLNKMHVAVSQYSETSLINKINSDGINDNVRDAVFDNLREKAILEKSNINSHAEGTSEIANAHVGDIVTEVNKDVIEKVIEETGGIDAQVVLHDMLKSNSNNNIDAQVVLHDMLKSNSNNIEAEEEQKKLLHKTIVGEQPTEKICIEDIENTFIDPDQVEIEHKSVYDMLMECRKNQQVIKDE